MPRDLKNLLKKIGVDKLYDVHETAKFAQCSEETIRRDLRDKTLVGIKSRGKWLIDGQKIKRYISKYP